MSSKCYPTRKIRGNLKSEAEIRKGKDLSRVLSEGFTSHLVIILTVCDSSRDT